MTRRLKLRGVIATLIAAFGVLLAVAAPASADTGAGGLTILHAQSDAVVHKCNVIGGANTEYSAVVCVDLITYEGASDYYVYDKEEAICQVTKTGQVVPCQSIYEDTVLETGSGATAQYFNSCGSPNAPGTPCPDGRLYDQTRNWDYSIAAAGGGTCSSNLNSSYQVYGVAFGTTVIWTPNGDEYWLDDGNANDGANESTGHYFVCP